MDLDDRADRFRFSIRDRDRTFTLTTQERCDARSGQELLRDDPLLERVVTIEQQLDGSREVLPD
jgi:hypothetical protein